jgi:Tfp pilus assembly protein PilF
MGWLLLYRFYKFKVAAYWLLPLWLVTEILYGTVSGQASGVAHWAHVGGFVFGGLIALGVQKSGLEQIAEKGIQDKISWVSHPLLAAASEQAEKNQLDEAESSLRKLLQEKPDSIEAYRMLQNVYWRKTDVPAQRETLEKIISLELKANDSDGAWLTYMDFRNSGGEKLSASLWLDLCRQIETKPDQDRAAEEYKDLAKAYPNQKQGLLAQMAAARIYLKKLDRPFEALQFYQAAQASTVPHGEWQGTIERGIAEANKARTQLTLPVAPTV